MGRKGYQALIVVLALFLTGVASCKKDVPSDPVKPTPQGSGNVYIVCEGSLGNGNSTLSLYRPSSDSVFHDLYKAMNGRSLATPSHRSQLKPSGTGSAFWGFAAVSPQDFPLQAVVTKELTVTGTCGSAGEYPLCLDLIAKGVINVKPSNMPIIGASTMKISVLVHPDGISATMPTFAIAATGLIFASSV